MIQEAVGRMLRGIREGREAFIPDLILIDGGKGHLAAARAVLEREGFEELELLSIAKRFETVYSARRARLGAAGGEVPLAKDSAAQHLLVRVRDEAHRFAVGYHRLLKSRGIERSALDRIPGIGPERRRVLLTHFDSVDELKRAGLDQIAGLPGMDRRSAREVWTHFHAQT
jgi:excinuclease ABC subunit C